MGTTFKIEGVVLESVTCCTCGTVFAVAQPMLVKLHQSGGDFYCPSGHILAFAESENDRLRKLAEQATERTREAVAELAKVHRQRNKRRRAKTKKSSKPLTDKDLRKSKK